MKAAIPWFLMAGLILAGTGCSSGEQAYHERMAQRLPRTLAILRTSSASQPKVLRILFYGQSITSTKWVEPAVARLRERYPNTRFVVKNMAIGGFSAETLEHVAERDFVESYPDLIVFHVYGDHQAYERIIRLARSRTAAEVIVQTDHETQQATEDTLNWSLFMADRFIPALADFYGLAVERRNVGWAEYRLRHDLSRSALMTDEVHPNGRGWRLMADLFTGFVEKLAATPASQQSTHVSELPVRPTTEPQHFRFDGNRVEIVASGPLDGLVEARVDGRRPEALDGCWQTSRTTPLPGVPHWPALRKVTVTAGFRAPERWTATISRISHDQREFSFALAGANTGRDGDGRAGVDFVSPSGRVRIAAHDWTLAKGFVQSGKQVPEGFRVQWSRRFACGDQPPVQLSQERAELRHVLATDLANGPHELILRLRPGAIPRVRGLQVYRPPLRGEKMMVGPAPPVPKAR